MSAFVGMPKIARYSRECIVTEKIDGTNAQIWIPTPDQRGLMPADAPPFLVGSKSRWITPEHDNFGFATWALLHREELLTLGPGHHFGEWWGQGIQRNYGLTERRFSLFNVERWGGSMNEMRPACCHVVPVLERENFEDISPDDLLSYLVTYGSHAAPGFMKPEGIVIYHTAANVCFKKTIENDEKPKGHDAVNE